MFYALIVKLIFRGNFIIPLQTIFPLISSMDL